MGSHQTLRPPVQAGGSDLLRREFFGFLGGAAAAWPTATRAQQRDRVRRIGIIDDAPIWNHFRQGLRDLGYIDGQNVVIEYRTAEGKPDRLAAASAELVRLPVDVIATFGTPASRAAKNATATIPIVAISIGDPVRAGLVASLARPGGNVTGNVILGPDLISKRLELLKELLPSVSRLTFLWNPDNASNAAMLDELRPAVSTVGVSMAPIAARTTAELDGALAAMMKERPDAFMMTNDPLHQLHVAKIIGFLAQNRVPGIFQTRENVVAGPDVLWRELSRPVSAWRVLRAQNSTRHETPGFAVEQPTKFELVVNLRTAKSLGFSISEAFLLRADEVIE